MRKTPLKRRTPLRSKSPAKPASPPKAQLKRAPLPRVNRARKAKRKAEALVYGPYHEWVGTQPCLLKRNPLHICRGVTKGHHLIRVGNGGRDEGNEVPLCEIAHTRSMKSVHTMGPDSFEAYWNVDLEAEASALHATWCELREAA